MAHSCDGFSVSSVKFFTTLTTHPICCDRTVSSACILISCRPLFLFYLSIHAATCVTRAPPNAHVHKLCNTYANVELAGDLYSLHCSFVAPSIKGAENRTVNEDMTQRGLAGLALPHPITLR